MRGINRPYAVACFLVLAPIACAAGGRPSSTNVQAPVNSLGKTKFCNAIQGIRTGAPSLFRRQGKTEARLDTLCAQIQRLRAMGISPSSNANANSLAAQRQRQACEQAAAQQGTHCEALDLVKFYIMFCQTPQTAPLTSAMTIIDLVDPDNQSLIPISSSSSPGSALQLIPTMPTASLTRRGIGDALDLLWTYTGIVFLSALALALTAGVVAAGAVITAPGLVFFVVIDFSINLFRAARSMCLALGRKLSQRYQS